MPDVASQKIALFVVNLCTFSTAFMISVINIALPSLGREFSVDTILLSWAVTSFLLTSTMLMLPVGKAADIYGRKKIFLYGNIIFFLATLLCAVSPSIAALICFRVMQGGGAALITGTGVAILTSVFPPGERGRVLGLNFALTYVGLSAGPALGGILTQHFGWRSVFLLTVPLTLLAIILVLWKIKDEWADAAGEKLDYAGSLIYGSALAAMLYGLTLVPQIRAILYLMPGLAGLYIFIRREMTASNPLLDIGLFTENRVFALSNLAALINYSSTYALGFLLSLYLQYIKGMDPQSAGFVLIAQPLFMALFSPFAGRLSEKVEPRVLASSGMAFVVAGLVPLALISGQTSLPYIIACIMAIGFGLALFVAPNTNAIMSSVQKNYYGVASATMATMRLTGQLFSMGIVTVIFALNMGQVQVTPEHHALFISSIRTAFLLFALLCGGGILASLARGKIL